jgi:2-polyprenyl-3-methyl-5-hydroxy-6-metoxy-1,4-benzoquinol methylase
MHVVKTIAELDEKIAECDRAERVSDEAMRAIFGTFKMDVPADMPSDPFSPQYQRFQQRLYEELTGNLYSTEYEATHFDVDAALRRPFPFYTNSTATAGEYFMAIGFVLRAMALPPGSRVLEFGPGWGITTVWLAQLGHHVTAVDIEPRFCELIQRRAAHEGVEVEIINSDFFWVETAERTFDAVLFYDCFHHCVDHIRLLTALRHRVAPNGRIYFGAEPIVPNLPFPWGLRLDGWSLWGIRKNGWMENGFRDDYFREALTRTGWFGRKIAVPKQDRLSVWEARHREAAVFRFHANDPALQSQVGQRHDSGIEFANSLAGTGLYGPYIELPPGRYRAELRFSTVAPLAGTAVMDVCADFGSRRLAQSLLTARSLAETGSTLLSFESETELCGLEVRLHCQPGFSGTFQLLEITPDN